MDAPGGFEIGKAREKFVVPARRQQTNPDRRRNRSCLSGGANTRPVTRSSWATACRRHARMRNADTFGTWARRFMDHSGLASASLGSPSKHLRITLGAGQWQRPYGHCTGRCRRGRGSDLDSRTSDGSCARALQTVVHRWRRNETPSDTQPAATPNTTALGPNENESLRNEQDRLLRRSRTARTQSSSCLTPKEGQPGWGPLDDAAGAHIQTWQDHKWRKNIR